MKKLIAGVFVAISTAALAYEPHASIWGENNSLVGTSYTASANYTIGTKFTVNVTGTIKRLIFYKSSSGTTTSRNLILWSSGGTNLAECTTQNEPNGFAQWLGCDIEPYDVSPGTTLEVSYDIPMSDWFNTGGVSNPLCWSPAPENWLTCSTALYGNGLSTFPTVTDNKTEFADIILNR